MRQTELHGSLLVLAAAMCSLVCGNAHASTSRYKYTLDPSRAEEIMSRIPVGKPLSDDAWLGIVGTDRDQKYTVQPGDNLWILSSRFFKNPFLWRKLWQVNSFLTNPHQIEIGQLLSYYHEPARTIASEAEIPLVKLLPPGSSRDLADDAIVNLDLKNRFLPPLVVLDADLFLGEIVGSYSDAKELGQLDEVYLRFSDDFVPPTGSQYTVVRKNSRVQDVPENGRRDLGELAEVCGQIRVIGPQGDLVLAELTRVSASVRRGDLLIALLKPVDLGKVAVPPVELRARILRGELLKRKTIGAGAFVVVNKGTTDGLVVGSLMTIPRLKDPVTKKTNGVAPSFKAEVQVVFAASKSSIGYITRAREPVRVDDLLVSAKRLRDSVRSKESVSHIFELD